MGLSFNLGRLSPSLFTDSSLNVGIGAAPSGSYKLEVTGTAKVSSTLLLGGALTGTSATFSSTLQANSTFTLIGPNATNNTENAIAQLYDANINLMGRIVGFRGANGNEGNLRIYTNNTTPTLAMTLTNTGNVGIGTSSPTTYSLAGTHLEVFGGSNFSFIHNNTTTVKSFFASNESALLTALFTFSNHPLTFGTNNTERMRITSGGDVQFQKVGGSPSSGVGFTYYYGATAPFLSLVGDNTYVYFYNQTAGAYRFYVQGNGQINATSTSITAISDISLKENIRDLETGLSEILKLKPRRFDWKEETKIGEKNVAGFIAQELESILPELVYEYQYNDKETKKSIKMGDILPTLVKAIQEQNQTIQELNERLNKAGL